MCRVLFRALLDLVKPLFESNVDLYLALVAFGLGYRGHCAMRVTSNSSELVIDGYPRSANSFAVQAFEFAQGELVRVGNHVHSPCNLIRGIRKGKPVILLIRPPKDAVLAYCALVEERGGRLSNTIRRLLLWTALCRYVSFHKRLRRFKGDMIVASFEDVTSDFGAVISRLNKRFGKEFKEFAHNREHVNMIFKDSPKHLSPSLERASLKESYEVIWDRVSGGASARRAIDLYRELSRK